jgi:uncharacterized protein YciI/heme-degrading monooxygenase HmoA
MHYLLFYEVDQDYASKRAPFREQHLKKAWEASERGELVLAGALATPMDGAVLLFRGDSPEVAERFAKTDPYVVGGAVKRWYVREWATVVGETASTPIRSDAASGAGQAAPILRMWRGRSNREKSPEYVRHVTKEVFPKLEKIPGHRGVLLLQHRAEDGVEFLVLTLWDSMSAVKRFAGEQADRAVVEPEAQAVLSDFDDFVTHFEVVHEKYRKG